MREYYKLYVSTFSKLLFKKSIVQREIYFSLISLLGGSIGSYLWKGQDFMIEQTIIFIAYSLSPLVILVLARLVYCLLQTPVKIYQVQARKIEKYGWEKVEFSHVGYSINNISGLALEIENKKDFDITEIIVEITKIKIGRKLVSLSATGVHRLGYIERDNDKPEDTIVQSLDHVGIESSRKKEFVVTEVTTSMVITSITRKFLTYPDDDIQWPFFPTSEDGILGSLSAISRSLARQYTTEIPSSQPTVIIEIEVRGKIKADDEIITLPIYILNLEVFKDGSLSWYGEDEDNEQENNYK